MKALFLGNPGPFAARPLWEWLSAGHGVGEFWCARSASDRQWRRDKRLGRVRPGWSVTAALKKYDVAMRIVGNPRDEFDLVVKAVGLRADVLLSAGFRYIIPSSLLAIYGEGAVNFHPTLLPQYRGPQPLPWMLLNGETESCGGVTGHVMWPEVDAGSIVAQRRVPWPVGGTFGKWQLELCRAAGAIAATELVDYFDGKLASQPQSGTSSYFGVFPRDRLILDETLSAHVIEQRLAALGTYRPLLVKSARGTIRVRHSYGVIGPRTGMPPAVTFRSVDFDTSDARVRASRWMPGTSKITRAQTWLHYALTAPAAAAAVDLRSNQAA